MARYVTWRSGRWKCGRGRIERHGLTTDEKGRSILASLLRKTDVVGYEVCRFGNRLARMLEKEAGCTVIALNPGDLRIIWKSRKKTDKEDALKIAKWTCRRRSGTASERGACCSDISLKEYLKKDRNGAVNRLCTGMRGSST
jgi:hypothetical protein